MRIGGVAENSDGTWSAAVNDARIADLLRAFDPGGGHIAVEGFSPAGSSWALIEVPLGRGTTSKRRVRRLFFDLLLTPAEAVDAADDLAVNFPGGGLFAWQASPGAVPRLRLLDLEGREQVAAMRGVGVSLLVDQPHAKETAILRAIDRGAIQAAVERLHD